MTLISKILFSTNKKCFKFVTLIILFICIVGSSAEEKTLTEKALEEILDAFFQHQADNDTGLAMAIFHEGEIIYRKYTGFADKAKEIKVDETTVFEWGSITKLMIWISTMQLKESGDLVLDEDIRDILPEDFLA